VIEAIRIASKLLDVQLEDVEFIVDPTVAGDGDPQGTKHNAPNAESQPATLALPSIRTDASSPPPPLPPSPPRASKPPLPKRHFASLGEFLCSEANRIAFTAAQSAATRPGHYTPLTLIGPPGCGKTHLLEGIWRQIRTSGTVRSVVYLTAEQFTNQFIDAIRSRGTGTPSFRR